MDKDFFNVLPSDRKPNGINTKTFKKNKLDKWLRAVLDESKNEDYAICLAV